MRNIENISDYILVNRLLIFAIGLVMLLTIIILIIIAIKIFKNQIENKNYLSYIAKQTNLQVKCNNLHEMFLKSEIIGKTGTWIWDVVSNKVRTSEGFNRIFDIDEDDDIDIGYILRRIHKEDRPDFDKAIELAFRDKQDYIVEYRIPLLNGIIKKLKCIGKCYLDKNGDLKSIAGIIQEL